MKKVKICNSKLRIHYVITKTAVYIEDPQTDSATLSPSHSAQELIY